ncbi:Carboxypeptidase regulatory-like domain-containing protein [Micrococcales bacterium KH10]|nr:Carboxypeptidase regulatory-like domain-containing protein [Micrococcales bacterium KH10]
MSSESQRTDPLAPTVSVEVAPRTSTSEPSLLRVHVRNVTDSAQDFIVRLRGLESSWVPAPAALPGVPADATITLDLPITPPAGTPPGEYPFVVEVEARTSDNNATARIARSIVTSSWRVDALSDLVLSVEPADARGLLGRTVKVQVANSGTQPRDIVLDTVSEHGLSVKLSGKQVSIAPQQSAHLKARLRARKMQLLHSSPRRSFTIIATGNQTPTRFQGTFQSRALLPSGVMRALSLILVIALWAGGTVIALPWLSQRFNADRVVAETATRTQKPDQDSSDPAVTTDPDTGDSGSDSPGGSGSEDEPDTADNDDEAEEIEQVRIAGAVTGVSPEGVTVNIRPASAFAPDQSGANSSDTTTAAVRTATHRISQSPGLRAGKTVWQLVTGSGTAFNPMSAALPAAQTAPAGKTWREALPVERGTSTPQARSTVTDNDGTWAFGGMDPNARYLVTLSKPGFQTARYFVTGAEAAQVPLEVSLEAGQGTISGQVTGPNGAAGGVEITLTDGLTTLTTRTATSGDVGSWSVTGLSTPSTYLVTAAGAGLGVKSRLVELAADGSQTVDMSLRRGVATLRGTISGPNSRGTFAPLGSMTVVAQGEGISRTATTSTAQTNTGTFILPDLPVPGKYTVTVSGDGYLTQIREISLNTRKASRALNLQLQRSGGTVVGTVKDEDGIGLAGAGMILTSDDNTYKTMSASDGEGGFRFDGITAGTYVLSGQIFGHETAFAQVKVLDGRVQTSDLVLTSIDGNGLTATSRIRGRAVDATTGASITCPHIRADEVCAVTITTDVTARDGTVSTISTTQLPDAQYTLPTASGLYPGRYTLTFQAPGYEPTTVDVEVAMNTVVEAATAALYPSPSISGNILTRVGSLPAGTCVVATTGDAPTPTGYPCVPAPDAGCTVTGAVDTYCAFADTATMGGYSINRLPSGTYQVRTFVPPNTEYLSDEIGVALSLQGGDARRYDATLDRLGRIALTALKSTGTGSLIAGVDAFIEAVSTGNVTFTTSGVANETGYLLLTGLPDSVYTITARDAVNPSLTGQTTGVTLGLNQEISVQLVITSGVLTLESRVLTQLEAAASDPVPNASVTVTGVVRYSGVVPVRETVTIPATNAAGEFTICTTLPCSGDPHVAYLPLIEENVDIEVTATNYVTFTRNNVPTSELATITLEPRGVRFSGTLTLNGATAADLPTLNEATSFTVISAPPGTGAMSLSADQNGRVLWSDSLQPIDPQGGRTIRPGRYVVRASLPGFDTHEVTFQVTVGQTLVSPQFVLAKYGELRVFAMAPGTSGPVEQEAPTMEIRLRDGTTRVVDAPGSRTYVDFGSLPSGNYQITAWLPGFAETTQTLTLQPGQQVSSTPTAGTQIVLTPLSAVSGVVYSQYGPGWMTLLSGARVDATHESSAIPFTATTDGDGSYRITGTKTREGLRNGDWTFVATAAGHAATSGPGMLPSSQQIELTAPAIPTDTSLDDELALAPLRGSLQVTVTNPDTNDPITQGITLTVAYDDGMHSVAPVTAQRCNPSDPDDPSFCFTNLLPLTYTLTVTGSGYAPVTTSVTINPGVNHLVRLPMTNPGGSVQGTVTLQVGSQITAVEDADVELVSTTNPNISADTTTNANGNYLFDSVTAGTYSLTATYRIDPNEPSSELTATRTIVVGIAQSLFVDLVLVQPTASITVEATSGQGFDLTGALVSLAGSSNLAPQPLARSSSNPNVYVTTFAQVPYGTFHARLSGPADHLGTHTSGNVTVNSGSPNATIAMNVNETRVQLIGAADSAVTTPPSTITATIGDLPEITLPVGDDVVVYVPQGTARTISGTSGAWRIDVPAGQQTVAASAVTHTATLTVRRHAVSVTLTSPNPNPVTIDSNVTWNFSISSPTATTVSGGQLTLQRQSGSNWTDVTTGVAIPASGSGTVGYTAVLPAGSATFRLVYSGAAEFEPATSPTSSITINRRSTSITVTSPAPGRVVATLSPAEAAASISSGLSSLVIETGSGTNWTEVTTGCSRSNNVLTCNGVTEGATARARFVINDANDNKWLASMSGTVTVTVTPPPPGPGSGG